MSAAESALFWWSVIGIALIWVALAFLVGQLATTRNRSRAAWVVLAILFSPLFMTIVLFALRKLDVKTQQDSQTGSFGVIDGQEVVRCPFCAEYINPLAKVCRFCGRDVAEEIENLRATDVESRMAAEAAAARARMSAAELAAERRLATRRKLLALVGQKQFRKWAVIASSALVLTSLAVSYVVATAAAPAKLLAATYVPSQNCGKTTLTFDESWGSAIARRVAFEKPETIFIHFFGGGFDKLTTREPGQSQLSWSGSQDLNGAVCAAYENLHGGKLEVLVGRYMNTSQRQFVTVDFIIDK